MVTATSYRPLERFSVVNLAPSISARYCGRLLAVLGADVVQSESDAGADRRLGYGGAAGEAFGRWLDQGKRLVARPEAEAAADRLSGPLAMVIVDGDLAPTTGTMPLVLEISAFGHDGPYAGWRASAPLLQALAGTSYNFGPRSGAPLLAQGYAAEIISGTVAFIAAAGAAFGRLRGHPTQRVEISDFESALCFAEVSAIDPAGRGQASSRLGVNRFVPTYPCGVFRSADGWIGITALTPAQWTMLCELVEQPAMAADPRMATTISRLAHADLIDALLTVPLRTRTTAQWVETGIRLRLPFAPVHDHQALLAEPMWRDRASFAAFDGGSLRAPTLPFRVVAQGKRGEVPSPVSPQAAGPLAGIRVVDFTMGWAGPLTTRHLGDLGADVIKIESDAYPDWWRGWERDDDVDPPASEIKLPFMAVNRNKRGIGLDLRSAIGLAHAKLLVASADIVIDNFAPGTLDRLGLGAAEQQLLRPGVISIAMGAFGAVGPLSGIRGYGSTVEQASGLPFMNGFEDWPPTMQHVAYGDPVAGLYGAVAALAALHGRERLGGVAIDLSQVECLFQLGADAFIAVQATGAPVPRRGSRRAAIAPCGAFPCIGADEWIAVAVDDASAWQGLCRLLERGDWAVDPALSSATGRNVRADDIEAAVAAWTCDRSQGDAVRLLQAAGVGAVPLLRGSDLLDDPHLAARDFWWRIDRVHIGRHWQAAPPYRLDGRRPPIRRVPPVLGEHTHEVLAEVGVAPPAV